MQLLEAATYRSCGQRGAQATTRRACFWLQGAPLGFRNTAMNAILQAQFQRVEGALNTLIDSISTYTPDTEAAAVLVAADDELSKGLEQRMSATDATFSPYPIDPTRDDAAG